MIGNICSLEGLPFPNEEFDFVFVVTYLSLCSIGFNAITVQAYQTRSARDSGRQGKCKCSMQIRLI